MTESGEQRIKRMVLDECFGRLREHDCVPGLRVQTDWDLRNGQTTTYELSCVLADGRRLAGSATIGENLLQLAVCPEEVVMASLRALTDKLEQRLSARGL